MRVNQTRSNRGSIPCRRGACPSARIADGRELAMVESAYGMPVLRRANGDVIHLTRVSLGRTGGVVAYDEAFVRDLVFDEPSCLPVSEIDRAYEDLVPICKELNTPSGSIDALFVTAKGRLVILEAKLWRNPEARRKVVAQVLDYARALSQWNYEDLQREISRRLGRKGNALFEIVSDAFPGTEESDFVDEVQRSLRHGRFLVLIVGDGIREGAGGIAEFLGSFGNLDFTFGLVELAIYDAGSIGLVIQPRTLARTIEIARSVVVLEKGLSLQPDRESPDSSQPIADQEPTNSQRFYLDFWGELLRDLVLDDSSQPLPNPNRTGNIFFSMPPSGATAWLTVYFWKAKMRAGVFLRFRRGNYGDTAYDLLLEEKDMIDAELGHAATWESTDGQHSITLKRQFDDLYADRNRAELKAFLSSSINQMVNAMRPRLDRIAERLSGHRGE